MIIVAGGDSFVFGSELQDCGRTHSKSTFPALLSEGLEYQCVAWPGYAGDSISRTVITACEQNKGNQQAAIVSWTFPGRYEFRFAYDTGQYTGNWYAITPWTVEDDAKKISGSFVEKDDIVLQQHLTHINRAKQTGTYDFAKAYYKHVGSSEYWETYSTLKEIVYLQNYLKVNSIPFMFTCASTEFLSNFTINSNDPHIMALYKQLDFEQWALFGDKGFWQWAMDNKYRMGTTHPLEEAHRDAATLLQGKFNELVKTHLE